MVGSRGERKKRMRKRKRTNRRYKGGRGRGRGKRGRRKKAKKEEAGVRHLRRGGGTGEEVWRNGKVKRGRR